VSQIPVSGEPAIFSGGPAQGGLSPDGRWLVLSRRRSATEMSNSIWLLPASGGDPIRLTEDGAQDVLPVWAPSGDRVYFVSDRPARGESGTFVMALDIDPASGRAVGSPRQVTLERGSSFPAPSPDGRTLAYRAGPNLSEIRVVPVDGGASRLVVTIQNGQRRLEWEPDGSAIYFVQSTPGRGGGLFRISAEGGEATLVHQLEGGRGMPAFSPRGRVLLAQMGGAAERERTFEIVDFSGRVLKTQGVTNDWSPIAFSPDGASLLGARGNVGSVIRVRPVQGGEARDLPASSDYPWSTGWTADSRSVIVHENTYPRPVVQIIPIDGGPARTLQLPSEEPGADLNIQFAATATHIAYSVTLPGKSTERLVALNILSGERSVLTENARAARPGSGNGPGGIYNDVDAFLYTEVVGDRIETRRARPGSSPRTLHSVVQQNHTGEEAFHGDRVAYRDLVGDSVAIMLAEPGREPRVLHVLGGRELYNERAPIPLRSGPLAFSFDGEWLAIKQSGGGMTGDATIVRVPREGRATDVRRVPLGVYSWYEPRWLPDNSGFTVIAESESSAWVAFVPVAPGQPVRHLSRAENQPTWGHVVSPDGKWVAYAAEVYRGTKLWRMELTEAVPR
jgi:Tol biopolymer transport system component